MKVFFSIILSLETFLFASATNAGLYESFPIRELEKTPVEAVRRTVNPDGSILLDFGRDAFAQLELSLLSHADASIEIHIGEKLDGDHIDRNPGGTIRYAEYSLDVRQGAGLYTIKFVPDSRNTRTIPDNNGAVPILMPEEIGEVYPFRYCEIVGLDGDVDLSGTRQIVVHYPFDDDASFFCCSDTVINKVWELCKYSIKATSFCGYYVDGDRERIPYEADALINQLSHYCVDSEYAMARRTAEYLFEHPTWPTEWQLATVFIAWYDYLYTGDKTLIRQYYDLLKVKTLLSLRDETGLISTKTGRLTPQLNRSLNYRGSNPIEDIVDWPRSGSLGIGKKEAGEADGYVLGTYNTAVNAMQCGALLIMSEIASALGHRRDAAYWRDAARQSKDAINARLLCADGVYRDGLDTDHRSLHANMFPLLFNIVPEECKDSVLTYIKSRGMACSVYGAQFLVDALFNADEDDYAISLLCSTSIRSWYNMIRCGSTITMEAWDNIFKKNLDWNHAWGAAPANLIPRWIAGVQPDAPGFRKALICPHLGELTYVDALVPTPFGGISCRYENRPEEGMTAVIAVPKKVKAKLVLPCKETGCRLILNGKPVRRLHLCDGMVVINLRSGSWEIELQR